MYTKCKELLTFFTKIYTKTLMYSFKNLDGNVLFITIEIIFILFLKFHQDTDKILFIVTLAK